MAGVLATVPRPRDGTRRGRRDAASSHAFLALAGSGFRRYATYRQATLAAIATNSVFGFLRCFVLLAALAGAGTAAVRDYDAGQLATYCWVSQGLIGVVLLWGWTDLADRIRTGDVTGDLVRPIHPVTAYLAVDLGRAGYAALTRFVVPVMIGALTFDLFVPARVITYPLFVVSTVLAVVVSFCCRFLVNASAYWLLDVRGVTVAWTFASTAGTGLAFPLHFLPDWLVVSLWVATPFPSMLQAPLDVLVERGTTGSQVGLVAGQAAWAVGLLVLCRAVQRRAERKLVVQGG
ncbi:MAG TPA: ABC-2 family transporter protein [Micromonosporaceae bacterium]|nr:ABC-2 family transporter protein [Micromonosporaceae bacterium]